MTYDNKGRINQITDQSKKLLKSNMKNASGKPHTRLSPDLAWAISLKVSYKKKQRAT